MVASFQYSGIVFGAIFGIALFGDHLPPSGWIGMALDYCDASKQSVWEWAMDGVAARG